MAFVTLRRSRNTLSYYLVESYRDGQGRSRKRTLCYLGARRAAASNERGEASRQSQRAARHAADADALAFIDQAADHEEER